MMSSPRSNVDLGRGDVIIKGLETPLCDPPKNLAATDDAAQTAERHG